jgi:hypothetical protein
MAVTATFAAPASYRLSVSKAGSGSGAVTSSPAGISCGSTCSHSFTQGSTVSLEAKAGKGFSFTGWSGPCTGTATCVVPMLTARSVRARFEKDCVVPKVKGKTLRVAKRRLKSHDCRVGKVRHAFSSKMKRGRVISQKPKARRVLAYGARVKLTLSRGLRR